MILKRGNEQNNLIVHEYCFQRCKLTYPFFFNHLDRVIANITPAQNITPSKCLLGGERLIDSVPGKLYHVQERKAHMEPKAQVWQVILKTISPILRMSIHLQSPRNGCQSRLIWTWAWRNANEFQRTQEWYTFEDWHVESLIQLSWLVLRITVTALRSLFW